MIILVSLGWADPVRKKFYIWKKKLNFSSHRIRTSKGGKKIIRAASPLLPCIHTRTEGAADFTGLKNGEKGQKRRAKPGWGLEALVSPPPAPSPTRSRGMTVLLNQERNTRGYIAPSPP